MASMLTFVMETLIGRERGNTNITRMPLVKHEGKVSSLAS